MSLTTLVMIFSTLALFVSVLLLIQSLSTLRENKRYRGSSAEAHRRMLIGGVMYQLAEQRLQQEFTRKARK